mmetsp:Transcript_8112/g.11682  ORF Transcript_8112/g.11682 Transcript_8112/m.11682 type:complete len:362 (+) Transcript_8112:143-1228(+)
MPPLYFPKRGHPRPPFHQGPFDSCQQSTCCWPSYPQVVPALQRTHPIRRVCNYNGGLPVSVRPPSTRATNRALNYSPHSPIGYNIVRQFQVNQERSHANAILVAPRPPIASKVSVTDSSLILRPETSRPRYTETCASRRGIVLAQPKSAEKSFRGQQSHDQSVRYDDYHKDVVVSEQQIVPSSYNRMYALEYPSSHDEFETGQATETEKSIKRSTNYRKKQDKAWDAMFEELRTFKNQHGTCFVPGGSKPHQKLGRWVNWQRSQRDKISIHRKRRLEEIGFCWDKTCFGNAWDAMFARLVAYRTEHGHCDVPQKYEQDPKLGLWVSSQRVSRGRISAERREALNSIGFVWKKFDRKKVPVH